MKYPSSESAFLPVRTKNKNNNYKALLGDRLIAARSLQIVSWSPSMKMIYDCLYQHEIITVRRGIRRNQEDIPLLTIIPLSQSRHKM
jgi:hypothetical protein